MWPLLENSLGSELDCLVVLKASRTKRLVDQTHIVIECASFLVFIFTCRSLRIFG
jgi:hypothetical protein